jgi:hypothetical protein
MRRWCHGGTATPRAAGAFGWPEGLAHYLVAHDVRLPAEFVEHVLADGVAARRSLPTPLFDELGQRDRTWPPAEYARATVERVADRGVGGEGGRHGHACS